MKIEITEKEIRQTLDAYDELIDRTNDTIHFTFRTKLIGLKK